jgi:hypothetical protein
LAVVAAAVMQLQPQVVAVDQVAADQENKLILVVQELRVKETLAVLAALLEIDELAVAAVLVRPVNLVQLLWMAVLV